MQPVSSRIWTRVAESISHDDNHYTTYTSKLGIIWPESGWYVIKPTNQPTILPLSVHLKTVNGSAQTFTTTNKSLVKVY